MVVKLIKMPADSVSGKGLLLIDGDGYVSHLAKGRADSLIPFRKMPPSKDPTPSRLLIDNSISGIWSRHKHF